MSSHHIVRDKQEPGVLILNWEKQTPELLEQLCQWSPIIIVHETCVGHFLDLGLKLNVVITGDKTLIGELEYQAPFDFIKPHKNSVELVEQDIMEHLHVLGVYPWDQKSNETHVFYKNGRRFAKISDSTSVWLSEEEVSKVYSIEGNVMESIPGNNALVDFSAFQGFWLERSC